MSLASKLAAFASSPQGRRVIAKATDYARTPEGRRKIAAIRELVVARGGRKGPR